MAKSTIVYNQFIFPFTTLTLDQTPVMSENGIDQIGVHYVFHVSGVIGASDITLFAQQLRLMQCQLTVPRKTLLIQSYDDTGTVTMYQFDEETDNVWGPMPGELKLTKFAGGRACSYSWSIDVTSKQCFGDDCSISGGTVADPDNILSISHRFDHSIDLSGYTTRTITGKLRLRSQAPEFGNQTADQYRNVITSFLPNNFQRESQQFTQSENGLELTFSCTDVEKNYTLPQPITAGQADYSVRISTNPAGDQALMAQLSLTGYFEASSNVTKATIYERIIDLVNAKFPTNTGSLLVWQDRDITESIYHPNRVSFAFSATLPSSNDENNPVNFNVGLSSFGQAPPGSNGQGQFINPYGQSGNVNSGVIGSVPQPSDACDPNPQTFGPTNISTSGGSYGSNPVKQPESGFVYPNTGASQTHYDGPMPTVEEVISYDYNTGVSMFNPKSLGASQIAQQTSNPSITVTQAGYCTRIGKSLAQAPPVPVPVLPNAVMLLKYISPTAVKPYGDGTFNIMRVSWRYVMRETQPIDFAQPQAIALPFDPRRPPGPRQYLPNVPAELNTPLVG